MNNMTANKFWDYITKGLAKLHESQLPNCVLLLDNAPVHQKLYNLKSFEEKGLKLLYI